MAAAWFEKIWRVGRRAPAQRWRGRALRHGLERPDRRRAAQDDENGTSGVNKELGLTDFEGNWRSRATTTWARTR